MKQIQYPTRYIVWDLETSGLKPESDRIIEICAITYTPAGEVDTFNALLKHDGFEVSQQITTITGITNTMLQAAGIDPKEAIMTLYEKLKDGSPHVTHNGIRFDIPFLLASLHPFFQDDQLAYEEFESVLKKNAIDTAVLFKAEKLKRPRRYNETFYEWGMQVMNTIAKGLKYSVSTCCEELKIQAVNQHRAHGDVTLTNQIYRNLVGLE